MAGGRRAAGTIANAAKTKLDPNATKLQKFEAKTANVVQGLAVLDYAISLMVAGASMVKKGPGKALKGYLEKASPVHKDLKQVEEDVNIL